MRLSKDPEPEAMDTELEADILRTILEKISGVYVKHSIVNPKLSTNSVF